MNPKARIQQETFGINSSHKFFTSLLFFLLTFFTFLSFNPFTGNENKPEALNPTRTFRMSSERYSSMEVGNWVWF
ncbi:hypothetical protein HanPSC8_Chr14g0596611 [Helianthus annuus]|nr:hypothetical protein HanPSC8_Chr14g0596611 [Helianthus annuus]